MAKSEVRLSNVYYHNKQQVGRTSEVLQRISEANIKHGRQTKDKLAAQRHAAKVGRWVRGELKRIQRQIVDAGLMPEQSDDFKAASSARVRSKQPV